MSSEKISMESRDAALVSFSFFSNSKKKKNSSGH